MTCWVPFWAAVLDVNAASVSSAVATALVVIEGLVRAIVVEVYRKGLRLRLKRSREWLLGPLEEDGLEVWRRIRRSSRSCIDLVLTRKRRVETGAWLRIGARLALFGLSLSSNREARSDADCSLVITFVTP